MSALLFPASIIKSEEAGLGPAPRYSESVITKRAGYSKRRSTFLTRFARALFLLPPAFSAPAPAQIPAPCGRLTGAFLHFVSVSTSAEIMHPRLVLSFVQNFYLGAGSFQPKGCKKCANASLLPASFVACWRIAFDQLSMRFGLVRAHRCR